MLKIKELLRIKSIYWLIIINHILLFLIIYFIYHQQINFNIIILLILLILTTTSSIFFIHRWQRRIDLEQQTTVNSLLQSIINTQQRSDFLRAFLDASPDLIYIYNSNDEILGCNLAFEQVIGYSQSELTKLNQQQLQQTLCAKFLLNQTQLVEQTQPLIQSIQLNNGEDQYYEINTVICYQNQDYFLLGFARNVTERLRYLKIIEDNAKQQAELMMTISHELRTPLNGIIGISHILLDSKLTTEQRTYLNTVYASAVTLNNIFNDIIDFNKYNVNEITLHSANCTLTDLITEIALLAEALTQQKKLNFQLFLAENLPEQIYIDKTRLMQILCNLVSNAIKFTEHGKVVISIAQTTSFLVFKVIDTGCGIPEENITKIFDLYYQANNKPAVGVGLGLYIAKQLATKMQANLICQSKLAQGSEFSLELPLSAITKLEPQTVNLANISLALEILLVEDLEINIVVAKFLLQKLGHQVTVAMNAKEALQLIQQHEFDLALIDIQLPDMDGFTLVKQLRNNYQMGNYTNLPVLVALTANIVHSQDEYIIQGMDAVLQKPLSSFNFNQVLQQFFATDELLNSNIQSTAIDPQFNLQLDPSRFNQALINDLINILGIEKVIENLDLFSAQMSNYCISLLDLIPNSSLVETRDCLSQQAHKIKSACSAVGLVWLQMQASNLEHIDILAEPAQVLLLIENINQNWQTEIITLKQALLNYKNK